MTARIKIKVGGVEVECEATEAFLKDELPALLNAVSGLYEDTGKPPDTAASTGTGSGVSSVAGAVSTFSQKLGVKSGTDLIIAAAARLTLGANKAAFTRDELSDEMKLATGYYKKSYMNNLSKYLVSLVKSGDLVQPSATTYALSPTKKKAAEQALA